MLKQYYQSLNPAGGAPPVSGNAVSAGYTVGSPGGACSVLNIVWVLPIYNEIETGIFVFEDRFLTQPLLGYDYITDSRGEIFEMDSSNGQVGNSTGLIC